jgi:hypothetical protein
MTLAAILVFYFLSVGSPAYLQNQAAPAAQTPAPAAPSAASTQTSTAPAGQPQSSTTPARPEPAHHRRKKTADPDCSTTAATTSADNGGKTAKPCAPPKVVIRNGGTDEPTVQLKGDSSAGQAPSPRSTTDLALVTEENLKKIAGRQLTPSERDTVNQIKQFMDQSKAAVAAGDLERGHNLAVKARLLSDELVKP